MCCCVVFGLDSCLWKDMDEYYTERQLGLEYDPKRDFTPAPNTCEACCGNSPCRLMQLLLACGFTAALPGIFDVLWCCVLARQRRQVRAMYGIGGSACLDCLAVCCCRCCMFDQMNQQLRMKNPNVPSTTPEQVNTMRAIKESDRNKTWTVSNKEFKNPTNRNPNNPQGVREYV